MNFIIFSLVCYGICNNLIFGSIFEGFRNFLSKFGTGGYTLHKLFTCFMCLGTWVGFFVSAMLILTHSQMPMDINNLFLSVLFHGMLSTAAVWVIHTVQEAFERAFTKD